MTHTDKYSASPEQQADDVSGARRADALRRSAPPIVGTLLLAGLVALGVAKGLELRDDQSAQETRNAAVALAERTVVNLTTLSAKTSDRGIQRLLSDASPAFKKQLTKMASALRQALTSGHVTSSGQAVAAGVESQRGDKIVVIVAASGTVQNATTTSPEPRHYRLRVTVDSSSGRPLVSKIGFVG